MLEESKLIALFRYLLWERHGAQLRLAQWDWLRMKVNSNNCGISNLLIGLFQCTTIQYIANLKGCCDSLKEIIAILGPIRVDAEEGAIGLKVMLGVGMGIEPVLVFTNNNFLHLHHEEGKKGESLHQMQFGVKFILPCLVFVKNLSRLRQLQFKTITNF